MLLREYQDKVRPKDNLIAHPFVSPRLMGEIER